MEKIISKFKKLSRNIGHEEIGQQHYFASTSHNILESENAHFLEKYHKNTVGQDSRRSPDGFSCMTPD